MKVMLFIHLGKVILHFLMWFLHVNKNTVTFTFIEKKAKFAFVKNNFVFAKAKQFSPHHRPHHAWILFFENVAFALPTVKFECERLNFTFTRGKKIVAPTRGFNAVSVSLVFTTLLLSPANVSCSRGTSAIQRLYGAFARHRAHTRRQN